MGEHKRNPTAIYFKENPWAPDFRPLFGKRRPRGKGIRRVYKILMELEGQNRAKSAEPGEKGAERAELVTDCRQGEGTYKVIKPKRIKNPNYSFNHILIKLGYLLSPIRLLYLPLVKRFKNV